MFPLRLVSVVDSSVRPLGATFRWPGATARPGQRGGYSGWRGWRLVGAGATVRVGVGSDGSVDTFLCR
jgi:hypothetical protein